MLAHLDGTKQLFDNSYRALARHAISLPRVEILLLLARIGAIILVANWLITATSASPNPVEGVLADRAFSSFLLTIMAAPLILSWVVQPFAEHASRAEHSLELALESAKAQSMELTRALAQLNMHKQLLDRHALVKETAAEGCIIFANDALCRVSGYSREELVGQNASILNSGVHSDEFWWEMNVTVADGNVWQGEVSNRRKDGSEFWLVQSITAVFDSNGDVVGYIDIGTDITENKVLHEENLRKSKLANLGQLTATVAHEIRNPLGAIKTAAFVLQRKIKDGLAVGVQDKKIDVEPQFQRINSGISRCDKIITELLDYTRIKALEKTALCVDDWVRQAVQEELKNIPPQVQISFDLTNGNIEAAFNADQMRRVIVNLLSNASEAMVGKGDIPAGVEINEPSINIRTSLVKGTIEITVKDSGPGISPENIAKIREPLFTTKSFGVGLGIPAIEKILESHGGGLRIESVVGEGASMTAWFPISLATKKAA